MFYSSHSSSISCSCSLSNVASNIVHPSQSIFFLASPLESKIVKAVLLYGAFIQEQSYPCFPFRHFLIDWFQLFIFPPASLANEVFHLSLVVFLSHFSVFGCCFVYISSVNARFLIKLRLLDGAIGFFIAQVHDLLKSPITIDNLFILMFRKTEGVCDYKGVVCACSRICSSSTINHSESDPSSSPPATSCHPSMSPPLSPPPSPHFPTPTYYCLMLVFHLRHHAS